MWNRARLRELASERLATLQEVEGAYLAFVRQQEMTDEPILDQQQLEQELVTALDKLEPEATRKLERLGSIERDEVLRDFVVRVMAHNQQRLDRELTQVLELEPEQKLEHTDAEPAQEAHKKKRRLRLGF